MGDDDFVSAQVKYNAARAAQFDCAASMVRRGYRDDDIRETAGLTLDILAAMTPATPRRPWWAFWRGQ